MTESQNFLAANNNNVHIIGIGGAGMSAIATVLHRMGKKVSGSDLKESHVTERLRALGIKVNVPHDPSSISEELNLIVCSTAISQDNVEITEGKNKSIPILTRAQMLSAICSHEKSLGIAGSHGKTTTTSMVTSIARAAGMEPSFMIGGDVNEIGTNAAYNHGSYLIVEADESDRTFLDLDLVGAIVTNIENDHLESYHDSFAELKESFLNYVLSVKGPVVICVDEANARLVAEEASKQREVVTVGREDADWIYSITQTSRGGISASIKRKNLEDTNIDLAVPGEHNIKNSLCAYALMASLGVDDASCIKGLASFGGVARRFQFRGETNGITFVDDYAHLPTEISATLSAARQGNFRRIISIFQPHRYSRTEALYKEFAKALESSDCVIVCEVYSAGEEPRPGVSGSLIANELSESGHDDTTFALHVQDISRLIKEKASAGDLVLTLGAGDVTMFSDIIQTELNQDKPLIS